MTKEVKEIVAVRLEPSERRRLKAIAARLRVSETELMRYAIKAALDEFAPLTDQSQEGAELLPVFLQNPGLKTRLLGLDAEKIDSILHADLENEQLRVSAEDIAALVDGHVGKGYTEWLVALSTTKRLASSRLLTPSAYLREKYVEPVLDAKLIAEEEGRRMRSK
jgi:hypothetical protein